MARIVDAAVHRWPYLAVLALLVIILLAIPKLPGIFEGREPGTTATMTPEQEAGLVEFYGYAYLENESIHLKLYLMNQGDSLYTFKTIELSATNFTAHLEFRDAYLVLGPREFVELQLVMEPGRGDAELAVESMLYEMTLKLPASSTGSFAYSEVVLLTETWRVDRLQGAGFNPVDLSFLNIYTGPQHGYVALVNVSVEKGFLKVVEAKLFAYHDELLVNKVLAGNLSTASLVVPASYKPIEILGKEVSPTLSRLTVYYESYEDMEASAVFRVSVVQVPSLRVALHALTGEDLETYVPVYRG